MRGSPSACILRKMGYCGIAMVGSCEPCRRSPCRRFAQYDICYQSMAVARLACGVRYSAVRVARLWMSHADDKVLPHCHTELQHTMTWSLALCSKVSTLRESTLP